MFLELTFNGAAPPCGREGTRVYAFWCLDSAGSRVAGRWFMEADIRVGVLVSSPLLFQGSGAELKTQVLLSANLSPLLWQRKKRQTVS